MKKILTALLSVIMVFASGISANAEPSPNAPIDEEIIEEYQYTAQIENSISISGKTATCLSIVRGFSGTATKVVVTHTLQKKNGSTWSSVTSWSKTFNSWYAMYSTSKSSLSSGTYRLKTVAKVYSGNNYETITVYSGTASC